MPGAGVVRHETLVEYEAGAHRRDADRRAATLARQTQV
jgi:hypothetical protein